MKNNIAIELINITKEYVIHHEKPTLVEKFVHGKNERFRALQNINLTIKKGEKVGIFGPNGSGKTTLLKIICGITSPTTGSVSVNGRIVSLIDIEAGFHPDLTGYQNIFINGLLLGMNKSEIKSLIKKIINFADIKQFIDTPLFMYSSGMKLRLGFAIAIFSHPDILILDENIGVGDQEFQNKSEKILSQITNKHITLICVSHRLDVLFKLCKTMIWLEQGNIHTVGDHTILPKYLALYSK